MPRAVLALICPDQMDLSRTYLVESVLVGVAPWLIDMYFSRVEARVGLSNSQELEGTGRRLGLNPTCGQDSGSEKR